MLIRHPKKRKTRQVVNYVSIFSVYIVEKIKQLKNFCESKKSAKVTNLKMWMVLRTVSTLFH
jgi:hypothetical protein